MAKRSSKAKVAPKASPAPSKTAPSPRSVRTRTAEHAAGNNKPRKAGKSVAVAPPSSSRGVPADAKKVRGSDAKGVRPRPGKTKGTSAGRDGVSKNRPAVVERETPKTQLTAAELAEFRDMLLAKRREILGDLGALSDQALSTNRQDAAGDLSMMPNHMADLGSDNWEQEFTLGLLENHRQILSEIDEALERIDNGTYGICLGTGKPITKARLRAKPWAKHCIEYARLRELGRVS